MRAFLTIAILACVAPTVWAQTYGDFHLGAWIPQPDQPLSLARSEPALAADGNLLLVVGGGVMEPSGGSGFRSPSRVIDCFSIIDNGARVERLNVTGPCGLLPDDRQHHSAVLHGGYVFIIGGRDVAATSVQSAPIQADGSIGSWTTAGTLPSPSAFTDSLVIDNHLVVVGAGSQEREQGTGVLRAPILAGGVLGAWETMPSIPWQGTSRAVVRRGNVIYVLGGSSVAAPIEADGSIGGWEPVASPRYAQKAAGTFGQFLYAFGADCAPHIHGACEPRFAERVEVRPDGSLGTWERTSGWQARGFRTDPALDMTGLMLGRQAYTFGGFNEDDDDTTQNVFDTILRSAIGAPRIRAVQPHQVPEVGGVTVEIVGVNFVSTSRVFVGGTEVALTGFSAGSIRFIVPRGAVGATTVRVVNPDGEFDTAPIEYAETLPRPPRNLAVSVTGLNARLQWDPPQGGPAPTGYVIELGTSSGASDVGQFELPNIREVTGSIAAGRYFARVVREPRSGSGARQMRSNPSRARARCRLARREHSMPTSSSALCRCRGCRLHKDNLSLATSSRSAWHRAAPTSRSILGTRFDF